MKTSAVVLCALFATAVPAFAHGGGESGGPVMAPGGPAMSLGGGFPIQGGFPISSPIFPERTNVPDRMRRERTQLTGINYDDICTPLVAVATPTLYPQYHTKGYSPCSVMTQNGILPLPPAFTW